MSSNNNSTDIIVKGSILQEREEEDYPDPNTLPPLPTQEPRITEEEVTLSELVPGKYVSTTARVVYLRAIEKQDSLGTKVIFSGILEDSTFRVPFVSHRISYPLIRNCVYKFQSAYVHEFPSDRSLLLVITEYTKINPKDIEDFREFIWKPKIDSIKRPVRSLALQGVITTVHGNSGLIKRCNKCKSIFYDDACPNRCPKEEGWGWDLRVSCRLYDGSGSMKMVLTKDIASKVLQRNLAELVLLVSSKAKSLTSYSSNRFPTQLPPSSEITLKLPDTIDVIEAVTEDSSSSSFRSSDKIIISDGRNLLYFPPNEEDEQKFSDYVKRPLKASDIEDRKIIRRLIEKALDIGIRKHTGLRKMQGIYLLEEPVPLYRCEQAKLYLGFSVQVTIREEKEEKGDNDNNNDNYNKASTVAIIETTPQSYVRESVLDYVRLRRGRGASANSVINNLTKYRNKVIVAPSGNYGCIVDVIARKAASQQVSDTDHRNLVEFWKQIYGIDISLDEIPLLKVKMINSENVFTYPPSMCFFGNDSLFITADVQKFVEYKKSTVKARMDKVVNSLVNEEESLRIGDSKLEFLGQAVSDTNDTADIQVQLLHEVRQKLFGRNVMARGSAMFVHDEIWFFPNQLRIS
jgi:hypothetical protein